MWHEGDIAGEDGRPAGGPGAAFFDLLAIVRGYQRSRAVTVAAQLGVADLLEERPRAAVELARETGADEDALYRLLRALAAIGVLDEQDGRRFALTQLGEHLRRDHPLSVRPVALAYGADHQWDLWRELPRAVRTGRTAEEEVLGTGIWEYMRERPELNRDFDDAMRTFTAGDTDALLDAYRFGRHAVLADIGGGTGTALAAVLGRWPGMRGVLFDQPGVVAAAEPVLDAAQVADRVEVVAGDFFDAVPAGADAYLLKRILHDWPDDRARAILGSVRRAIGSTNARLLVADAVVGEPNADPLTKFLDLMMLVAFGGRERSLEEWRALLSAEGFVLEATTQITPNLHLLEAVPDD